MRRWKELKQTCQLHDFVGYSENAVKWQIWTGILVRLLLRFLKSLSKWKLSFGCIYRVFAVHGETGDTAPEIAAFGQRLL